MEAPVRNSLLQEHWPELLRIGRDYLKRRNTPDDIADELIAEWAAKLTLIDGRRIREFEHYSVTILVNLWRAWLRDKARAPQEESLELLMEKGRDFHSDDIVIPDLVARVESSARLRIARRALGYVRHVFDPADQDLFIAFIRLSNRFSARKTVGEVAGRLGLDRRYVENRFYELSKTLREELLAAAKTDPELHTDLETLGYSV